MSTPEEQDWLRLNALALEHHRAGRIEEALAALLRASQLRPDDANLLLAAAGCLRSLGRLEEAAQACRRALAVRPDLMEAYTRLASCLHELVRLSEIETIFRQAIERFPTRAGPHQNLGWNLYLQARLPEACEEMRLASEMFPSWIEPHSRRLFAMLHDPARTPDELFREHVNWANRHAAPLTRQAPVHANSRNPDRRLRIGYVSPDFLTHPVMSFLEPALANHDHSRFEIFCYASLSDPDQMTARLRTYADVWREIHQLPPPRVAEMIQNDGIDILVDLFGHTNGPLLTLFAQKPAPLQVSYLGYPGTTGLSMIDYRLTDSLADPPGLTEPWHTERLFRLDPCAWCFCPPAEAPEVSAAPCAANGFVTFGSFSTLPKVTPQWVSLWTRILQLAPESRLVMKARSLADPAVRARFIAMFEQAGIVPSRVEFLGRAASTAEHLASYSRIDVALDPYPYHGTTMTCETMWMGVPIVTLAGPTHVSRVGVSLLHNVGLEELVAQTPEDYIRIAASLAADPQRIVSLRSTLRSRMAQCPLRDEPALTRRLESAYRQMWRRWCAAERH